ncbi:heavy metal-binding domain-containing protein [Candidatus Bathyarchaeota archaeon]|nr:heavy metal-binding domain-containing protein [Candidatus Bathyarchaeota archaeon]
MSSEIIVVTTPSITGYRIVRVVGPIYGMTIRSRGVGGRFVAGIQGMFGGEITSYVSELENARRESLQRLMENARKIGANAVLSTDFETSDILQSTAIIFSAYGTAVVVEPVGLNEAIKGRCPNCGVENPPEARFCTKCGTALQ